MKKYNKPEIMVEEVSIKEAITVLTISGNKAANFDELESDSWSNWEDLFA